MEQWLDCKNILCIRTDNMGDLLMSIPAIRGLKTSFRCRITLLTSPMAAEAARCIPEIDEIMVFNSPWNREHTLPKEVLDMVDRLKVRHFDAAIVLSVYSQNPLPAALLAFMADIPKRLAYCRENPYQLLTHWIPEEEPYFFIQHQVKREIRLVEAVGAAVTDDQLSLKYSKGAWTSAKKKLALAGVDIQKPWIILHPGVSEKKREYPEDLWIEVAKQIKKELGFQLLVTGNTKQKEMVHRICSKSGTKVFSLAGLLSLEELIALIAHAPLLISVNTATIHIAAATQTPVIALYALTNPQHTPWKVPSRVLIFHPPENLPSKNRVVRYAYSHFMQHLSPNASPVHVIKAVKDLLKNKDIKQEPEILTVKTADE